MSAARIGIDFGGTKIEIAALDAQHRELMPRRREDNPRDYDAAIALVRAMIAEAEQVLGAPASIGFGTPGSINPRTGLIRNSNSVWLNGRPFKADVEAALGRAVRMANDANCLALSEARDGAAAGAKSVFAVIIGTGCGGGLVVDGRLVEGASLIAGEFGHVALPWPDESEFPAPPCWCGLSGCLETWISGSGFARAFRVVSGRDLEAPDIVAAAQAGDAEARAALDAYIDRLARGLAMIANIVDPACFVLGGGMSKVAALYETLPARVAHYAFCDEWHGRIEQPRWGDSSGVRGAAMLWD